MRTSRLLVVLLIVGAVAVPAAPAHAFELDIDTVGAFDPERGRWHLSDLNGNVTSFYFGNPGDVPFLGDWDCDGYDTPGLYRSSDGFVYLRNANTQGVADIKYFFGNPGDVPLAGDFDGDGCDTVSVYRPAEGRFFIINELGSGGTGIGAADVDYVFGDPGDQPFSGDFDGDGIDTVGLYRPATGLVFLRNSHTQGVADLDFIFGDPGDRFVAGDWTADGVDTPGLRRPSDDHFYLRYSNSFGPADRAMQFGGTAAWVPVAGRIGPVAPGPDQVSGLDVGFGNSEERSIGWLAVPGVAGYSVYWSEFPGEAKTVVATIDDETNPYTGDPWEGDRRFFVDGLGNRPAPGGYGIQCYRIATYDAQGREGLHSVEDCLPGFTASAEHGPGSGELIVSWTALPPEGFPGIDVGQYDVYWSLLPGAEKQMIARTGDLDQFGLPWPSPDERFYIDGLPPRPPRRLVAGLDCYIVFASSDRGRWMASAEVCFS